MVDKLTRRTVLRNLTIGTSGLATSGLSGLLAWGQLSGLAHAQTTENDPFFRPFRVPPLDTGTRKGNEVQFELELRADESNFFNSTSTASLGINGSYLGPVLRAKKGDSVSFTVQNGLNQDATLHWHGLMLPAKMDGGPHQVIRPGETWKPTFNIIQAAASYWYHAHTHRLTGHQVYHGLAGMFIIDDEQSENLNLPSEYGVDDIPVVIQDRAFNQDGSFRYITSMHDQMRGMLGNTILVNGVFTPRLKAKKKQLRLRLLNGSNARIYDLELQDRRPFTLIAGDGGFLPSPARLDFIRLAPGERAEILIDLSDGQDIFLRNRPRADPSGPGMMRMGGGNETFEIMKIVAPEGMGATPEKLAETLISLPDWQEKIPDQRRSLQLEMLMGPDRMSARAMGRAPFSINGDSMAMDVINFRVKKNSFEVWEISNNSMLAHPFHIHNTQFRVLERSGRSISPSESGLKDTVLVYPGESVKLMVPFPKYTDPQRPYMYHCHILEHEDGGMMGQFTVES